jgi:hypothetical protein
LKVLSPSFFGGLFSTFPQGGVSMRTYMALPAKPIGICAYFDKIQFWVRNPLDRHTLAVLERACGRGGIHIENRLARFSNRHRQYRQRIELRQPSQQALRWLAQRNDVLINRAEIALDLVFKYRADAKEAWDFLHQHLVRRWHGKKQQIRAFRSAPHADDAGTGETRYDAGGWAPNLLIFYAEDHTRITGEHNCLHLEWRLNGLKAVRAAGIESGQDVPKFDHRAFWQKRMLFCTVDRRRLGLQIRNRLMGTSRRSSRNHRSSAHRINSRTGEVYARSYDTVQELIDKLRSSCRVDRALVRISNETLLPE